MNGAVGRLIDFFACVELYRSDGATLRRVRRTAGAAFACGGMMIAGAVVHGWAGSWLTSTAFLAAVLFCVAAPLALRAGRDDLAGHLVLLAWVLALSAGAVARGGVGSPAAIALCLTPVVAAVLAERRTALVWSFVACAVLAVFYRMHTLDLMPPDGLVAVMRRPRAAFGLFALVLLGAAAAAAYVRQLDRELDDAEARERAALVRLVEAEREAARAQERELAAAEQLDLKAHMLLVRAARALGHEVEATAVEQCMASDALADGDLEGVAEHLRASGAALGRLAHALDDFDEPPALRTPRGVKMRSGR